MTRQFSDPPRIALLYCAVFAEEVAMFAPEAPGIVARREFEIGLHDRPDELRATLQSAVDEIAGAGGADAGGIEAVALLYGLCGRGTAGLRAPGVPLVIPRAHDCITVFLGSASRFAERAGEPCYYYTPGWNRARRVPGPDREAALREEFAKRFGPGDAEFLMEAERGFWTNYNRAAFVELGTPDAEAEAAYAKSCADWLGWGFERLKGDPSLLRDLLAGRWDKERFLVVPPGSVIAHSPDERILRAVPEQAAL